MEIGQMRQIASLHFDRHLSVRQTASEIGASVSAVNRALERLKISMSVRKENWTELMSLDDAELAAVLFPEKDRHYAKPNFEGMFAAMRRDKNLRFNGAAEMYYYPGGNSKIRNADGLDYYSMSRLYELYTQWKTEHHGAPGVSQIPCAGGDYMEIDFSGDAFRWHDGSGMRHHGHPFVAVMRYSGLMFAEIFENETTDSWIRGIRDALGYFGGVPRTVTLDNARSLVAKADAFVGELTGAVKHIAGHYGFAVHTSAVRRPTFKSEVERGCGLFQSRIQSKWSALGLVCAASQDELNAEVMRRVEEFNRQPFKAKFSGSRRSVFEEQERPHLGRLPAAPYELCRWKYLAADSRYLVKIGQHRFMVHWTEAGKRVLARIGLSHVWFYDAQSGTPVGDYALCEETFKRGNTAVKTELMSETDRAFRRGLGGWLEHFRAKGWLLPHIEAFLREVCGEGLPAMALNRRVTGVASLCSIYGATRTDLACALCAQSSSARKIRAGASPKSRSKRPKPAAPKVTAPF